MTSRRFVLLTHRWIGLSTSVVLAIAGATGAVLAVPGPDLLRRVASRLHETLALGSVGNVIVLTATGAAVVLQLGGVWLWWKRKSFAVRFSAGWRRAVTDLHHSAGALGLVLMLLVAVTGVGMTMFTPGPERAMFVDLHTARKYALPIKILYALGSLGFLVQGVTGVLMWWRPRPGRQPVLHVQEAAFKERKT
jgi:uncharacterized iron-regulated membrane protein